MTITIISGGQTGADQGGLEADLALGLPTGGWMPKGFITQDGPRPDFVRKFGVLEHASSKYPPRTEENVKASNATIRFATDFSSAGEKCTLRAIKKYKRPYFDIHINYPPPVSEVKQWLIENKVVVLNIAGNSERTSPGIQSFVIQYLTDLLTEFRTTL